MSKQTYPKIHTLKWMLSKWITILSIFLKSLPVLYAQQTKKVIQPIPIELVLGSEDLNLGFVMNRPLAAASKFTFFNVTNFGSDFKNTRSTNTYVSTSSLKFEFIKRLTAFIGVSMNSTYGFRPSAGLGYSVANEQILVVFQSGLQLTQTHNSETIAVLEYKPRLTETLGLYAKVQVFYSYDLQHSTHTLSYTYVRFGISWRQFQFGPAADFNAYGPTNTIGNNYGAFIRKEL